MKQRKTAWILIAIALAAFVSRSPLTGVGVLQEPIRQGVGLNYSAMGLLTTIPVVMYILSALGIGRLKTRFGLPMVMAAGLAVLSVGLTLRSWCGAVGLILGTACIGVGISAINVLIPAAIKEYFPQRVGMVTGFYSICMYLASATAAATAVPLYNQTGSWKLTLCIWLPIAVAGLLVWFFRKSSGERGGQTASMNLRALLRRPVTWMLALMMGTQSVIFYGVTAWLPAILTDQGFSADMAGRFTSVYQLGGILGSVLCTAALARLKKQGIFCFLIGAGFFVEVAILAFGQNTILLLVCAILLGACCSSSLSAINCIAALRSKDAEETAGMIAVVQTAGYPLAAIAPTLMGALFDATVSWLPALAILAVAGAAYAIGGVKAGGIRKKQEVER